MSFTIVDQKTKSILETVNHFCPESADPEINYALKCYYLKQEPKQEEIDAIIERRNREIEELKQLMELTDFSQLEVKPEDIKDVNRNISNITIKNE